MSHVEQVFSEYNVANCKVMVASHILNISSRQKDKNGIDTADNFCCLYSSSWRKILTPIECCHLNLQQANKYLEICSSAIKERCDYFLASK